jgi:hypothetical protein
METDDREIFVPRGGNDPSAADNGELTMTGSQAQNMPAPCHPCDEWARGRQSRNAGHKSAAAIRRGTHRGPHTSLKSVANFTARRAAGCARKSAPRTVNTIANIIANATNNSDTISTNRRNKEARA